ncbi:MAG: hypothetical protein IKB71_00140 [Lentisphaeria bacterium]|nr:hypothetical protein [Lentisphaeria bacterium]
MKRIFKSTAVISSFCLLAFMCGCSTLSLEERIIKEGEEQKERLAREQKNYEDLKSRIDFVCTPVVIPNYRNHHLNVASIKLAASCKRASQAMIKYIADKEKEDNIRNVLTKVFMDPENYIEMRPTRVGEFPRADGTVQKMSHTDFAVHLLKIRNKITAAASEVMIKEQKKSKYEAQMLKFSVIELWQMELAKIYMDFAKVMTQEERKLYRKELQDYELWNDIVAGNLAVRKLTESNKKQYFTAVIRELDTAASVTKAVLIEIERFRRICASKHAHKKGWKKGVAIAAEAARIAPYAAKATEQSLYARKILSYMTDEWALSWYDVENDLMSK